MTRDEISLRAKSEGGMFAVIPAVVLKDEELSWSAKMLYGIITWKYSALFDTKKLSLKLLSDYAQTLQCTAHFHRYFFRIHK